MIRTDRNSHESGVVSIFTVIFFMIFISIIVVGFVKVVTDEQRQAADNDLSSSALASAQSGAEDGKRLLIYCNSQTSGPTKTACDNALSSTACDAVTGNTSLTNVLDVDVDTTNGRQEGIVSKSSAYEQRYTCMTVKTRTSSIEDIAVENGTSELIPLSGVGNFDSVQFSWHATADDRDKQPTAFVSNGLLPSQPDWKNISGDAYPAAMRLEFIAYQKNNLRLDALDGDSRTLLLLPGRNALPSVDSISLSADARAADPNDRVLAAAPFLAKCNPTNQYACTMTVNISGAGIPNTSSHNYFLRVSAIYGSAYIKAELKNGNSTVQFDGVQPVIDVTGRANDVFRRLQTRVEYSSNYFLPQYALESGARICKDMLVTDQNATSADNCL